MGQKDKRHNKLRENDNRFARISFKQYLQRVEEELSTSDLDEEVQEMLDDHDQYVVIGNPGNYQPSSLWPETVSPTVMTKAAAGEKAAELNAGQAKLTFGVSPSTVHWHAKSVSAALNYVSGFKAENAIRELARDNNEYDIS